MLLSEHHDFILDIIYLISQGKTINDIKEAAQPEDDNLTAITFDYIDDIYKSLLN